MTESNPEAPAPTPTPAKGASSPAVAAPEPTPESVRLRVIDPWLDSFVGTVDEKQYRITSDGTEVPANVVEALQEQAARVDVDLDRVEN